MQGIYGMVVKAQLSFMNPVFVFRNMASVELPEISFATSDMSGGGLLGSISMPGTGQLESAQLTINLRGLSHEATRLRDNSQTHELMLNFKQDVLSPEGNKFPEGSKIFFKGVTQAYSVGSIENGSITEGSATLEALYYREIINGKETIMYDKIAGIYRVDGKELLEDF